jgi:hypothetical protein
MRTLDIVAAAAVAFFIREILRTGRLRADRRDRRESLHTWETEGGAVPVSRSTTAAQVSPPPDAVLSS